MKLQVKRSASREALEDIQKCRCENCKDVAAYIEEITESIPREMGVGQALRDKRLEIAIGISMRVAATNCMADCMQLTLEDIL